MTLAEDINERVSLFLKSRDVDNQLILEIGSHIKLEKKAERVWKLICHRFKFAPEDQLISEKFCVEIEFYPKLPLRIHGKVLSLNTLVVRSFLDNKKYKLIERLISLTQDNVHQIMSMVVNLAEMEGLSTCYQSDILFNKGGAKWLFSYSNPK